MSEEVTTRSVVYEAIAEILPHLAGATIPEDVHLRDLGADSVDRVEVIVTITQRLQLDTPLSDFGTLANLAELIDYADRARRTGSGR